MEEKQNKMPEELEDIIGKITGLVKEAYLIGLDAGEEQEKQRVNEALERMKHQ